MKTKEEKLKTRIRWLNLNKDKVNAWNKKYYNSHKKIISKKFKEKLKLFRLKNPRCNQKMENNGSWKGGVICVNGYKLIRAPEHKRNWNGYVQEHILIMEKCLGRELSFFGKSNPNNEVVHHKDENTLNNSIDNLELMTHKGHLNFHTHKNGIK